MRMLRRLIGILVLAMVVLVMVQVVGAETAHVATHVVISEVQIKGDGDTKHDFVEIYNPTGSDIDLGDYKGSYIRLMKYTSGGSESLVKSWKDESAIVLAHGYYLWASSSDGGYPSSIGADASTTPTIAASNAVALEIYSTHEKIDIVGWGSAPVNETSAYPDNPSDGESIERKAITSSTASDMAPSGDHHTWGNGEDTNNNSADFITKTTPEPQNTSSDTEDCPAQSWFLSDVTDGGDHIMYKENMSKPEGTITVSDGSSTVWKANEPATVDVGFPAGSWTGTIMLSEAFANGETFTVEVGSYDGSTFTSAGSKLINGDGSTTYSLSIPASAFTVQEIEYLALQISLSGANLVVKTGGGNSYIISPETDPGYPVPELPTLILFSIGLITLTGYVLLTKRRK